MQASSRQGCQASQAMVMATADVLACLAATQRGPASASLLACQPTPSCPEACHPPAARPLLLLWKEHLAAWQRLSDAVMKACRRYAAHGDGRQL